MVWGTTHTEKGVLACMCRKYGLQMATQDEQEECFCSVDGSDITLSDMPHFPVYMPPGATPYLFGKGKVSARKTLTDGDFRGMYSVLGEVDATHVHSVSCSLRKQDSYYLMLYMVSHKALQ